MQRGKPREKRDTRTARWLSSSQQVRGKVPPLRPSPPLVRRRRGLLSRAGLSSAALPLSCPDPPVLTAQSPPILAGCSGLTSSRQPALTPQCTCSPEAPAGPELVLNAEPHWRSTCSPQSRRKRPRTRLIVSGQQGLRSTRHLMDRGLFVTCLYFLDILVVGMYYSEWQKRSPWK